MSDNERDELAALLGKHESMGCGCCAYGATTPEQDSISDALDVSAYMVVLADAILAAGFRKPRTITTVEELDALPIGAVVILRDSKHEPHPAQKGVGGWCLPFVDEFFTPEKLLSGSESAEATL